MEKLSAPSGLHAAHRCSGVHDVGTTSLAPTGRHLTFMFCLETVCGALCWMKPIVLILLFVKPTDASTIIIALLFLLQRQRDVMYCPLPAGPLFHARQCP